MRILLAVLAAMFLSVPPAAAQGLEGRWAARTAQGTYAILAIGPDGVHFSRPKGSFFGGGRVGNLGPEVAVEAYRIVMVEDGRMTIEDAQSRLELSLVDADHVLLSFPGAPVRLFFSRAGDGEQVTSEWHGPAEQALIEEWPDNPEMARLFAEDQAARQGAGGTIDWAVVGPADAKRRARARELLEAGALHSGNDFYAAAFLFQHGDRPEDYLAAHTLAIAAAARGRPDAGWIAAASLDRYLRSIGKPQVYGTQFGFRDGGMTQQPYDPAAVPDSLRAVAGVPSHAEQEVQRQAMEAQAKEAGER